MIHCFISGGITGVPDYLDRFEQGALEVRQLGFQPVNPAKWTNSLLDDGVEFSNDAWMRLCFSLLNECDLVYFLDNWMCSNGANQEYHYALLHRKPVLQQVCLENYLKEVKKKGQLDLSKYVITGLFGLE